MKKHDSFSPEAHLTADDKCSISPSPLRSTIEHPQMSPADAISELQAFNLLLLQILQSARITGSYDVSRSVLVGI